MCTVHCIPPLLSSNWKLRNVNSQLSVNLPFSKKQTRIGANTVVSVITLILFYCILVDKLHSDHWGQCNSCCKVVSKLKCIL